MARDGYGPTESAKRAGYNEGYGYQLLRKPAVIEAIHRTLQSDMVSVIAPEAFKVARTLMNDDKVSPRVRADISFKFMDRAGHIAPANKDSQPQKALSEMTRDELLQFIDRNQAAIDKVEQELAERATDVSAPRGAPDPQVIDDKPLSFLD